MFTKVTSLRVPNLMWLLQFFSRVASGCFSMHKFSPDCVQTLCWSSFTLLLLFYVFLYYFLFISFFLSFCFLFSFLVFPFSFMFIYFFSGFSFSFLAGLFLYVYYFDKPHLPFLLAFLCPFLVGLPHKKISEI